MSTNPGFLLPLFSYFLTLLLIVWNVGKLTLLVASVGTVATIVGFLLNYIQAKKKAVEDRLTEDLAAIKDQYGSIEFQWFRNNEPPVALRSRQAFDWFAQTLGDRSIGHAIHFAEFSNQLRELEEIGRALGNLKNEITKARIGSKSRKTLLRQVESYFNASVRPYIENTILPFYQEHSRIHRDFVESALRWQEVLDRFDQA